MCFSILGKVTVCAERLVHTQSISVAEGKTWIGGGNWANYDTSMHQQFSSLFFLFEKYFERFASILFIYIYFFSHMCIDNWENFPKFRICSWGNSYPKVCPMAYFFFSIPFIVVCRSRIGLKIGDRGIERPSTRSKYPLILKTHIFIPLRYLFAMSFGFVVVPLEYCFRFA